jgi:predicted metal-binding transcription factor (methanogenesis marker protein 9)
VREYKYPQKLPKDLFEEFLGEKKNRVAVLGAFDVWPFMHKICMDVIQCGFAAVTSRYIYRPSTDTNSGYYRTKRDHDGMEMNRFLREKVIGYCDSAIIVYSSPGANYNEAEWCNSLGVRTLGINFTRDIHGESYCEDCIVAEGSDFSYCCGEGDAWTCASKKPCPFKDQGIGKSQLDYFLMKNANMSLISVEKLEKTTDIVNDFLQNKLNLPNKLIHVFEFRVDISDQEYIRINQQLDTLNKKSEDSFNPFYEYIDYYYKPVNTSVQDWLTKKHSLRIRQFLSRVKKHEFASVFYSQVEQTPEGFYCREQFGGITWFEGNLETAKKWLEEMGMECFLKIIKAGKIAYIPQTKVYDTKFKVFLEIIEVEKPADNKQKYGYSLEVELWTDKPRNMMEIGQKKSEILKFLGLEGCQQKTEPVQEFIYRWINNAEKETGKISE